VKELFRLADVSVVPNELAKMEGFFAGVDQVSKTINNVESSVESRKGGQ